MRQFGLIGFPLGHSFSRKFFSEKFSDERLTECRYNNFPIPDVSMINSVIEQNPDLEGFNVTIPYKEAIIQYLDEIDTVAAQIGAVNTVRLVRHDKRTLLYGYNTDAIGFLESLKPVLQPDLKKALILGNGGAAKAVKYALHKAGLTTLTVSRRIGTSKDTISWDQLDVSLVEEHRLIVNTTPLGTYPAVDQCPALPFEGVTEKHLLYDLVYNPQETLFLQKGKQRNAQTMNGLAMLELQALAAWEIWNK